MKKANADRLIRENFLYYDKLARHKKITYTLHSELEDKEVLFDANYLELIVNNLLSNAFKYTESGQSITVTLKEENGWLLLQVSDTGIGIPINKQGKIFERFYQIESEHVGSGIGLSLVQRLIELHHGRIELDSEENKGSTFSVYLPQDLSVYKPSELASNDELNEEEQVYSTNSKAMYFIDTEKVENESVESGDKKRGTILIVEDNNEIRRYLSNGLADLFNTLEAGNGEEALEKLKDNEVDVIVTDVMMPVMNGIKLCKNVKQNIRTCHIPVIILSAKTDIKDQMEGLQMGADDYIPKPFSLAILTTKIQNMMRTRRRMLEKYAKSLEVEPEKITFNAMDEALLKRAMAIVEKNMDNIEFSTDEFAREMNMSRSNLHLKLKAITGESTIDFIRKIRFNEAAKLLKDGRYTVAEEEPEKPTKPRQKESILIVEDNSDIRQYLCEELGKLYNVLEAKNGKDALEIMKEQEINLILTDVMMPVMDGLQLCKQIKQNLNTCHIPVIILSAKADLEEQLEGLHMGADDYIPKPFSLTLVTTKIRNLFRTRYRAIQYYSNSLEIEPEKLTLSPLDEEVLKKAMEIMEQHLDDVEFSTEEFAREMCMSRSSLHLKMKALTGESTNDFIRKIRFNRACKLLKEGRYTVAEISVMVGFSTPSYFATSFKKYFGCLPSEYIKNK